jgi:acyl carrier protein
MNDIEATVYEVTLDIARERTPDLPRITGAQRLSTDLGFGSLDLAQLVATLELRLGLDPFASTASLGEVHTMEDLCRVYRQAQEAVAP